MLDETQLHDLILQKDKQSPIPWVMRAATQLKYSPRSIPRLFEKLSEGSLAIESGDILFRTLGRELP
jgi:hypothetical protein